jgi:hypothetical protein
MSSNGGGPTPSSNLGVVSEARKQEFQTKQKLFDQRKRKRDKERQLEDRAHELAWEVESLHFQEEELLQLRQIRARRAQRLTENADALADMELELNAEREKLANIEMTFDAQKKSLECERQEFSAEEEAIGSLERDIESARKKLAADKEQLALAQQCFEENDDRPSGDDSTLEIGNFKRRKDHNCPGLNAEGLEEDVDRFPATPSSSNFRPVRSDASGGTNIDGDESAHDGYGFFLGSPEGKARGDMLKEIRRKRRGGQDSPRRSIQSEDESDIISDEAVEAHRLALVAKATKRKLILSDASRLFAFLSLRCANLS